MSEQASAAVAAQTPFEYDRQVTISVNVSDLEEAIDWYREALGFELIYKLDEYGWCEVATPIEGVSIGLNKGEGPKGGGSPFFGVRDIEAARRHLESAGARFEGQTTEIEGMVKLASFSDPDGNTYGLAQNLSAQA
ncbi:MAG: VOC family protein [Thermoleophilia bacterium]|nr:VOC family protein [Thermoleophilia bacterium]